MGTDRSVYLAGRLSPKVSLYLLASIAASLLAGSSAPTPLYAIYQAQWGFSPITTTVVFGVYAIAVLAALLTAGKLSDYVGRRAVLLVALSVQVVSMVVFATAGGVPELMVARIIQGLSTGAAIGAIGAGMLDFNRTRGTLLNAIAPITGTATGGLVAGILVQYLPSPTHLVYWVLLASFVLQGIGVALMPETATRTPGAIKSLVPEIKLPRDVRRPVLVAIPVLVAVWSLAGLYGALGPSLVRVLTGSNSHVLGGLSLFALAGSGAVSVLFFQRIQPEKTMAIGILALLAGVGITLIGIGTGSTAGFFIGSVIAGIGFGGGFQGSIKTVLPLAAASERAGVLSLLYVVSYLALGVPAVIGGFRVVHGGGLLETAREYGIGVMVLAAIALVGLVLQRQRSIVAKRVQTARSEDTIPEFAEAGLS
jgi:predicted MFS family arabinose efflux permease